MDYIIGIDAGGTKSSGTSYRVDGEVIDHYQGGFGNFAVDIMKTKMNIEELLDLMIGDHRDYQLVGVYIGVSGISSFLDKDNYLKELMYKYDCHVEIVSDIKLAKEATLQGKDGILFVLGTGFAVLGSYEFEELLYGGWGHIIGDPCSGYAIGLGAIRKVVEEFELNKVTDFSYKVLNFFGIGSVYDLKQIVYSYPKDKVASIAEIIVKDMHHNKVCFNIIVEEITKMVKTLERIIKRLGYKNEVNMIGVGSIFENIPMIKQIVEANLFEYSFNWINPITPTYGSYFMHLKHEKG